MQHYFSAEDPVITPKQAPEIETLIQQLVASIAGFQVGVRSLLAVRMLDLVARLYQYRQKPATSAARPQLESARMDILTHATERMADAFSEEPVPVERVLKLLGELRYLRRLKEEAGAALDEL